MQKRSWKTESERAKYIKGKYRETETDRQKGRERRRKREYFYGIYNQQ